MCDFANNKFSAAGVAGCNGPPGTGKVANLEQESTCGGGTPIVLNDSKYVCAKCPPGFDCSGNTFDGSTAACAAGKYQTAGADCQSCTKGKYCPSKSAGEASCPTGTYQPAQDKTSCELCPKDKSCTAGGDDNNCSGGQYSPLGLSTCKNCPAGHDCSGDLPVPCAPGTFNDGSGKTCSSCPAGKYCDNPKAGNGNEQACADGTYSTGGAFACLQCPPGNKCTGGNKTPCGSSEWALAGANTCNAISATDGYDTSALVKTAEPPKCPLGYYSQASGPCKICEAGSKCLDGKVKTACLSSENCPGGVTDANTCATYQDCPSLATLCPYGKRLSGGSCVSCA